MTAPPRAPFGLIGAVRSFAAGVLATVHERIELLTVEFQEEKHRLIRIFVWSSAAVFSGVMTLTFASLLLVYLFWETARLAVLGGLAAFYAAALVGIILVLRRILTRGPAPFAATIGALRDDGTRISG
jgi:uncharacterized membrane protein YqjE